MRRSRRRNEFCQRGRIAVDDDRSDLCDLARGSEEHFGRTFCRADAALFAITVGERFDCALAQPCDLERGLVHREQRAQVLLLVAGSPTGSVDRIISGADEDRSDRRRRRVNRRQVLVGAGTFLHCDVDALGRKIGGDALAVWQECAAVAGRHQRRLRDCLSQDGRMQDLRIIDGGQNQLPNASSRCSDHATLHA